MIVSEKPNSDADKIKVGKAGTGTVTASAAAILGANLVVVALAWDNPPDEGGIVTITFLMMIAFVEFINVMHYILRYEYLIGHIKVKAMEEKVVEKDTRELNQISKWVRYFHGSGLLFTMVAFWIISYKYLISLAGYHIAILLLPFILFILYWLPKAIGIEKEVAFLSAESLLQILPQIVVLALIFLDFFKILRIP